MFLRLFLNRTEYLIAIMTIILKEKFGDLKLKTKYNCLFKIQIKTHLNLRYE